MAQDVLVWLHSHWITPASPVLRAFPGAPVVYVFDDRWLLRHGWSSRRIALVYESLLMISGIDIRRGDTATELRAAAEAAGARRIAALRPKDPWLTEAARLLPPSIKVLWHAPVLQRRAILPRFMQLRPDHEALSA